MCAAESSTSLRKVHRSIIKSVPSNDSDCISIDDYNRQNSSTLSLDTDLSRPTGKSCSEKKINCIDTYGNTKNTSLESVNSRLISFSRSPNVRRQYQPFRTPPPKVKYSNNNNRPQRSQSFGAISLSPLRETITNDSGTGDSVFHILAETSAQPVYQLAPVFGQSRGVFIANRFDFDSSKIAQYVKCQGDNPLNKSLSPSTKSKSKSNKRDSNDLKKSTSFFSLLSKPFKKSISSPAAPEALIRHHPSVTTDSNNH